jgi:hypothetical protein
MTNFTFTPAQIARLRAEHKVRAVDLIQELRRQGYAWRHIASELQRQGIAPPCGFPGQRWHIEQVRRLVRLATESGAAESRASERAGIRPATEP